MATRTKIKLDPLRIDGHEVGRAVEHYRAFLDHRGADYADRVAAVRARLATLAAK